MNCSKLFFFSTLVWCAESYISNMAIQWLQNHGPILVLLNNKGFKIVWHCPFSCTWFINNGQVFAGCQSQWVETILQAIVRVYTQYSTDGLGELPIQTCLHLKHSIGTLQYVWEWTRILTGNGLLANPNPLMQLAHPRISIVIIFKEEF